MRLSKRVIVLLGCILLFPRFGGSQEYDLGLFHKSSAPGVDEQIAAMVASIADQTQQRLDTITRDNWTELQSQWREQLREMLALPQAQTTDLQVTFTGDDVLLPDTDSIESTGGVRVRKLHFQSLPGLYVTANLYLPEPAVGKPAPAILYVCGHSRVTDHGRLLGNKTGYQHHGIWFARHGFVCLMIDTTQLGELHGEHHGTYHLGRWDWIAKGFTPAGVEAYNGIRALDVLQSLPQVDGQRIGMTGRSGGGAYTWFVAAMDDRVKVAVPVAGITDLENHLVDRCIEGHCDCMYMNNLYRWDYSQLAALIAPRPLLLANSDADRIFPLDGVMRVDAALRKVYKQLGAQENYHLLVTPGPHQDTPELQLGAFRWLTERLGAPETSLDMPAEKKIDPKDLLVFPHGTPKDERVTDVSGWFASDTAKRTNRDRAEADDVPTRWRLIDRPDISWGYVDEWRSAIASDPAVKVLHESQSDHSRSRLLEIGDRKTLVLELGAAKGDDVVENVVLVTLPPEMWSMLPTFLAYAENDGFSPEVPDSPEIKQQYAEGRLRVAIVAPPLRGLASPAAADEVKRLHRSLMVAGSSIPAYEVADLLRTAAAYRKRGAEVAFASLATQTPVAAIAAIQSDPPSPLWLSDPMGSWQHDGFAPSIATIGRLADLIDWAKRENQLPKSADGISRIDRRLADGPPQFASGVRILEVTDRSAHIWCRTTRNHRANLADQPLPQLEQGDQKRHVELPIDGPAGLAHATPGTAARLQFRIFDNGRSQVVGSWTESTIANDDFVATRDIDMLRSATRYRFEVEAQNEHGDQKNVRGDFRTLPDVSTAADFKLAVMRSPRFADRDGPYGFNRHIAVQKQAVDACVLIGDPVAGEDFAGSAELIDYAWQRVESLPTAIDFHQTLPCYYVWDGLAVDAEDTKDSDDDADSRQELAEKRFSIFRRQTALPDTPYRSLRIGRDLEIWLTSGMASEKGAHGDEVVDQSFFAEQAAWLRKTIDHSDARYKVIVAVSSVVTDEGELGAAKPLAVVIGELATQDRVHVVTDATDRHAAFRDGFAVIGVSQSGGKAEFSLDLFDGSGRRR